MVIEHGLTQEEMVTGSVAKARGERASSKKRTALNRFILNGKDSMTDCQSHYALQLTHGRLHFLKNLK